MARSLKDQAFAVIRSRSQISRSGGMKKVPGNYKPIKSIRSLRETSYALSRIATNLGVSRIKKITEAQAVNYLEQRKQNFTSQKSLDLDRKALSLALSIDIPRIRAISDTVLEGRSYSNTELIHVTNSMNEKNALSVRIAHDAGLRAHELLTLKRIDEGEKSSKRTWTNDRFFGQKDQVRYLVTGKGGLVREVSIRKDLSLQLENRRLESPKTTTDRGVRYEQRYDIAGGNALSASFTRASQRALGYSHGFHGVRHSYAQQRVDQLKAYDGINHTRARDIVAQELGHFRGDITEVYLR
jgi:integrase